MNLPSIISASAGSGKTHTVTEEMLKLILEDQVRPDRIIATTFTVKAAEELKERISQKLLAHGRDDDALLLNNALIGTVNGVCLQLLERHAYKVGISPYVNTLLDDGREMIINEIMAGVSVAGFLDSAFRCGKTEAGNGFGQKKVGWMIDLEKVISLAETNGIDVEDLNDSRDWSIQTYGEILPFRQSSFAKLKAELIHELNTYFDDLKTGIASATDKKQIRKLSSAQYNIQRDSFTWDDWASINRITKLSKGIQSEASQTCLLDVISRVTQTDFFQKDIEDYIRGIFELAQLVIEKYRQFKQERGFLDFADQERLVHQLCSNEADLQAVIGDEFDLLVVDEFQDTSPIQLSIFLQWTQVVGKSIWVGDPKQSIYGFRGTDPKIMTQLMEIIPENNKSVLGQSWRSTKELVQFSNGVFSQVFGNTMKQNEVVLQPAPSDQTGRDQVEILVPPVVLWRYKKGVSGKMNKQKVDFALVRQIIAKKESGMSVFDKESQQTRAMMWKDIAVLCRNNGEVESLSRGLAQAGVPVAAAGNGLMYETEVALLKAGLQLLCYPEDRLSMAELLLVLEYDGNQSKMIEAGILEGEDWGASNPVIQMIKKRRTVISGKSVVSLVESMISWLDIHRICVGLGMEQRRWANVEAFLDMAREYTELARSLHLMETLPGFLGWVEQLNKDELDKFGLSRGDAVHVLTYHRAKGLEWPVVIMHGLEANLKHRLFHVQAKTVGELDVIRPLRNRRIQLWPKPFDRDEVLGFDEYFVSNGYVTDAEFQAIEEDKRLFYVGVTRARDQLVFSGVVDESKSSTVVAKGWQWPHRVWNELDGNRNSWSVQDQGQTVQIAIEDVIVDEEVKSLDEQEERLFFPEPMEHKAFDSYRMPPSQGHGEVDLQAVPCQILNIHNPIVMRKEVTRRELGDYIHEKWCAFRADDPIDFFKDGSLLGLEPLELFDSVNSWWEWSRERWGDAVVVHRELPVLAKKNGQLIQGYCDLVIERDEDLILVDYKTFSAKGHEGALRKKAREFFPQIEAYAELLEKGLGKPVKEKWLYFVVEGKGVSIS